MLILEYSGYIKKSESNKRTEKKKLAKPTEVLHEEQNSNGPNYIRKGAQLQ